MGSNNCKCGNQRIIVIPLKKTAKEGDVNAGELLDNEKDSQKSKDGRKRRKQRHKLKKLSKKRKRRISF